MAGLQAEKGEVAQGWGSRGAHSVPAQGSPKLQGLLSSHLALSVCLDRICPDWRDQSWGSRTCLLDLKPPTYQG